MKYTKQLTSILLSGLLFLASCTWYEPDVTNLPSDKLSFNYEVVGEQYTLDYLVGSTIKFNNTSSVDGAVTWDFGDPYSDQNSSTEHSPTHIYEVAGQYTVKLSVDGEGVLEQAIFISDIFPTVTYSIENNELVEVLDTYVGFDIVLPNPAGKEEGYEWIFPAGTIDENGNPIVSSKERNPGKVKFKNVGSQTIVLKATLDGRVLEEGVLKVPVAYNQAVPTLYYASKAGNIMAYKLADNAPSDMNIYPFDLGVKSGNHPLNILFNDSSLYVLDCGKQFTYINDEDGNKGDGRISVISKDGSKVETMITNSGAAFNDPFYGYIESSTNTLYFSDRNTGISKIDIRDRNRAMNRNDFPYWVQNDRLGYYSTKQIVYGSMNACFTKVGSTWWWNKTYNGAGIFRFQESDIKNAAVPADGSVPAPSAGQALDNMFIKSLVVDESRQVLYVYGGDPGYEGFYSIPLDKLSSIGGSRTEFLKYRVAALVTDTDGASGEYVGIRQLALDSRDGSVYFGFRSGNPAERRSGLMRYNPNTMQLTTIVEGVDIYGVTINPNPAKLF